MYIRHCKDFWADISSIHLSSERIKGLMVESALIIIHEELRYCKKQDTLYK